jgi:hypothetical protein
MTAAALPSVLSLCSTPRGARSLLGAGLLPRLGALAPAVASVPAGWAGYTDAGERSPVHQCWCDALRIASTALGSLPQPVACAWFAPAVKLATGYRPRITTALATTPLTLAGLLELQATVRFVAQLCRIGGSEVPELDLREPLNQALHSLARLLLLSPTQMQARPTPRPSHSALSDGRNRACCWKDSHRGGLGAEHRMRNTHAPAIRPPYAPLHPPPLDRAHPTPPSILFTSTHLPLSPAGVDSACQQGRARPRRAHALRLSRLADAARSAQHRLGRARLRRRCARLGHQRRGG